MTDRELTDRFAGQAMTALIDGQFNTASQAAKIGVSEYQLTARWAYKFAEAMVEESKKWTHDDETEKVKP